MNDLMLAGNEVTMSSREIARLTGKRHDNVHAICLTLQLAGVCPEIKETPYIHEQNKQTYYEFWLNKRDSLVLVARLSPEFTAVIIDRWQELEAKQVKPLPNYQEALRQLADQLDVNAQQQALIEQQKPAVEFVERYVEAKSSKCLSDVAKILKYKPREFIQMLYGDGVIFRRSGVWIPYQQHIDAGRFTVHPGVSAGHAYDQTRVEPEGVVWLAKRYAIPSKSKEQA